MNGPTYEEMQLSKALLSDMHDLLHKFVYEAEALGKGPKYRNLPESVKIGMMFTAIIMLYASTKETDPRLFARTEQFVMGSHQHINQSNNHD